MNQFDQVVVGCNIEALTYAYRLGLPLIYTRLLEPFFLERFAPSDNPEKMLKSTKGEVAVGPLKARAWQRYYFLMSLSGMILYGDSVQSLFIDNHILTVGRKNLSRSVLEFKNLIVFDDHGVNGLPKITRQENNKNIVYDWINVHNGHTHDYDIIYTDSDFVNSINFYTSNRGDNPNIKDIVLISHLTDQQVSEFSYSDTMARFKTLDILKQCGIRGRRNGRDVRNPQKYKYYAIKLDSAYRKVVSCKKNVYENTLNIQFNNDSIELINQLEENHTGFLKKVKNII